MVMEMNEWDYVEQKLLDLIYFIKGEYPNHNSFPKIDAVLDPLWQSHKALKPLQEGE